MKPLYSAADFEFHATDFLGGHDGYFTHADAKVAASIAQTLHTPCAEERERMVVAIEILRKALERISIKGDDHYRTSYLEKIYEDEARSALEQASKILGGGMGMNKEEYQKALELAKHVQFDADRPLTSICKALLHAEEMLKEAEPIVQAMDQYEGHWWGAAQTWLQRRNQMTFLERAKRLDLDGESGG